MADAEFITDLALAIDEGIVSTSPQKLASLYRRNDTEFEERSRYDKYVSSSFDVLLTNLSEIQSTYITKPHIFHSFICALIHNRFGLPDAHQLTGVAPTGKFFQDKDSALMRLKQLAAAYEEGDMTRFGEFVQAASEGGNRAPQRAIRLKWLCLALQTAPEQKAHGA